VIRGRVEGSVRARQVQLASTARVEGDVIHASLAIESGAYFDGHCKRSSDPLSDAGKSKIEAKPAAKTAPSAPPPSALQRPARMLATPSRPKRLRTNRSPPRA
jgi:hypothetical protein